MSNHGPHFDEFPASPSHPHGGAEYDEFGRPRAATTQSTGTADRFTERTTPSASHGAHWDEGFPWHMLPLDHGTSMDSDFRQPAALDDDHGHGTWFDVFRGGTQVQAIYDGHDVEGVVINNRPDHVLVKLRDGRDLELGLQQLRAFRHVEVGGPDRTGIKTAHPGHTAAPWTRSTAEAPSAHDATAHGGGRTPVDVAAVGSTAPLAVKSLSDTDVRKTLDELRAVAERPTEA
jgi:hypothetical protein